MSLADFVFIGVSVFSTYVLLWAALFVLACTIIAIFVTLAILAMGRL